MDTNRTRPAARTIDDMLRPGDGCRTGRTRRGRERGSRHNRVQSAVRQSMRG